MRRFTSLLSAFCRIVLATIFWIAVRVWYDVKFYGLAYAANKSPAYFAMAHKRDLDPLVEIFPVLARRGWRALAGDVRFALRADAFVVGFLARLMSHPRWLIRILRHLAIGPLLYGLGVMPAENIYIRPVEIWLSDAQTIVGDAPAGTVLTPVFLQRIANGSGEALASISQQRLSHLLSWRYYDVLRLQCDASIFTEPVRSRVKQKVLQKLRRELANLEAWGAQGGSLWCAPEGQISPDGTLSPLAAMLYRLLQASKPDACIIPISITYDTMTLARPRIFVTLSAPIEHAAFLSRKELEARLYQKWRSGACFTCTQLASGFLVQMQRTATPSFTVDALAGYLQKQAEQLVAEGRYVDRSLLSLHSARERAVHYLRYAHHKQLVRRIDQSTWYFTGQEQVIQVDKVVPGYRQAPLVYAWNELQDMLQTSGKNP
jgi:1-acyl-sn-glycerol-3-phosphate acyltransferase